MSNCRRGIRKKMDWELRFESKKVKHRIGFKKGNNLALQQPFVLSFPLPDVWCISELYSAFYASPQKIFYNDKHLEIDDRLRESLNTDSPTQAFRDSGKNMTGCVIQLIMRCSRYTAGGIPFVRSPRS